jgi:hypothetical protein
MVASFALNRARALAVTSAKLSVGAELESPLMATAACDDTDAVAVDETLIDDAAACEVAVVCVDVVAVVVLLDVLTPDKRLRPVPTVPTVDISKHSPASPARQINDPYGYDIASIYPEAYGSPADRSGKRASPTIFTTGQTPEN